MSHRSLAVFLISCIAAGIAIGGTGTAQSTGSVSVRPADAALPLTVTRLSVPAGTLRVYLPDDVAAGDTISGTVVSEPAGRTDAERKANAAVLEGYVVDTGPAKARVAQRWFTFLIPSGAAAAALLVRDPRGKEIGRVSIPVRSRQPPLAHPPQPQDFRFPQVAVAGQPLPIRGPFSGDFSNSALTIGGQPGEMIAESPRTVVVAPAPNVSGPSGYRLTASGIAVAAPCNVLSLTLSAPKTSLTRGERVPVHVAVGGLAGIREPVNLKLTNATPNVVALAGGDLQALTIRPDEVGTGGTYATDRDVTGLGPGAFSIFASLDDRKPPTFVNGAPAPNALASAAPSS